jgi:hypothetical protein
MVEMRSQMGLLKESLSERLVYLDDLMNEQLERNLPRQAHLLGEIDDAHPATPEHGLDPETRDLRTDPGMCCARCHTGALALQPPAGKKQRASTARSN